MGGTYITHKGTFSRENFLSPDGQRAHGDFAYVFRQVPVNGRKLPFVF